LVSKNRLAGIGLAPIKSKSLGQRFLQGAQARKRSFTASIALPLKGSLAAQDYFDFIVST
jgi:hypothetical protein